MSHKCWREKKTKKKGLLLLLFLTSESNALRILSFTSLKHWINIKQRIKLCVCVFSFCFFRGCRVGKEGEVGDNVNQSVNLIANVTEQHTRGMPKS